MSYAAETYYRTLGLARGASDNEIRQAYRRKAKLLHPDRNKSANAHQDFITLTEAYEFLINHRHDETEVTYSQYTYTPTYGEQRSGNWQSEARERVRQRAAGHANMRYDEFVDTGYYRSLASVETVFRYFFILMLILLITGVCTFFIASWGWLGVPFSAAFLIMPAAMAYSRLKDEQMDLTDLHESGIFLLQQKWFLSILFTLFNLFAIIRYGFHTLIEIWWIPLIYLSIILCCMLFIARLRPDMSIFHRCFYTLCLSPLPVSILLAINFTFALHPTQEKYTFRRGNSDNGIVLSSMVYEDYPFITTFANTGQIDGNNTITYTFANGLLGIRVMKDYKFDME